MGFLIVILGRQQLFTENTLTPVLPLLKHRRWEIFRNLLRLWTTVLLANWVGTMAIAWVLAHSGIVEPDARPALLHIGQEAMAGGSVSRS